MSITLDPPSTKVDDEISFGSDTNLPDNVFVIDAGNDAFAATNFTTPPPDPMSLNGLCIFEDQEEANIFRGTPSIGLKGTVVAKTLDETVAIVKRKPILSALCLMQGCRIRQIQYV